MSYHRLSGKKRGFYSQRSLWLGADHLLAVDSTGYSENYRRFYFKDIQAVITRKSARGKIWNVIWAVLTGLTALLVVILIKKPYTLPPFVFGGALCVAFLAALLINVLRGPTCICHIRMPFAVHELPSLRRFKHVRKMLDELRPLVQRYQGVVSVEEIRARAGLATAGTVAFATSSAPALVGSPLLRVEPNYSGVIHLVLFGLLLADAAVTYMLYYFNNLALSLAKLVSGITLFVLTVMALSRQKATTVPGIARIASWVALANLFANHLSSYAYVLYYCFSHDRREVFHTQWAKFSAMAEIKPFEHPFMAKAYACYMLIAVVSGAAGLLALAMRRIPSGSGPAVAAPDVFAGAPGARRL
jgi:hypothetical protein